MLRDRPPIAVTTESSERVRCAGSTSLEGVQIASQDRSAAMAIKYGRPIEVRSAPALATSAPLDLTIRPRRNRKAEWKRRLVAESVLTADDLIWPLFLVDGSKTRVAVPSMPGI